MKKLSILLTLFAAFMLTADTQPKNLLDFQTVADAVDAGWKANTEGSEFKVENGKILIAQGATQYGGLVWRPENLDLTGVEKLCFKIRQNVHPEYPFSINIQIKISDTGDIHYINKLTPSGAGWSKWQEVTIDLSQEKLGKVSALGIYSNAFKNTKTKFLKITDVHFVRKPAANPDEKLQAVYVFPRMKTAPVIDGKIADDEWAASGGTSGFVGLNGVFAPRQTRVRYGYDDKFLYFAFASPFESAGNHDRGKAGALKHADLSNAVDFFELWLKTPEKHLQFMVNMNGGIFQFENMTRQLADTGVRYATTFDVNNYLAGGTWYGEIAVPLSALGSSPEQLKVLFARDFPPQGSQRSEQDWTSSLPVKVGFNNSEFYADAILSDSLPALRIEDFGNLQEAQINVSGGITNPASQKIQYSLKVFTHEDGTLLEQDQSLPAGAQDFSIGKNLKSDKETQAFFVLRATAGDKVIYAQKFEFACGSPLRIKCVPIAESGKLTLRVDTRSVKNIPNKASLQVQILNGDEEKQSGVFVLSSGGKIDFFHMDCAALENQGYQVKCMIKDGERVVAQAIIPDVWLGKPEWLTNLGITDEIPSPWTPIAVEGRKVSVTDREYILGDNGLPQSITSLSKNILSTPMTLNAQVDGKPEVITFKALELLEQKAGRVKWAVSGNSRSLTIAGTLTLDYDGFALWSIKVKPLRAGVLDAFRMDFSLPAERALYARANTIGGPAGEYSANLDGTGKKEAVKIAWTEHSYGGWAWPEDFFYKFFIGDDDSGLNIMTESPESHAGKKHIDIVNSAGKRAVTLTLTSGQKLTPGKELAYEYAWTGLPLKPRPDNPKLWHHALGATSYKDTPLMKIDPEFFKEVPVLIGSRYMRYDSHYQLSEPDPVKRVKRRTAMDATNFVEGMSRAAKYGTKVITDAIYFSAMDTSAPETMRYRDSWAVTPGGYSWYNYHGAMDIAACPNSSWQDFLVYTSAKILDETPLGGIYLDVSAESPCDNIFHGCGYTDESGQRRSTINLWSMRELHKRIYTYYNTGGRKGIMFHHHLDTAAWAGFCNAGFQGEEWAASKSYDAMTPEFFRAMTMNQYGTPYTFFSIFSYYQQTPMNEVMAICLPHYTQPAIWSDRKGNWPAIKPYWNIMDDWWTSAKFVGYWHKNPPSNIKDKDILVSAYVKNGSTLLVIANWKRESANIDLEVNSNAIGFQPSTAYDLLNKKPLPLENSRIKTDIPPRDVLLILLSK